MYQSIDFLASYTWIKQEIFQRILREKFFPDGIVLNNFTLEAALAKGENYGSQMIRVKLFYTKNDNNCACSLIIKTGVLDENVREIIETNGLFVKEVVIYRDVIPEVYRLLAAKNIATILAPVYFSFFDFTKTINFNIFYIIDASKHTLGLHILFSKI